MAQMPMQKALDSSDFEDISSSIDATKINTLYYAWKIGKLVCFSLSTKSMTIAATGAGTISGVFTSNLPVGTLTSLSVFLPANGNPYATAAIQNTGTILIRPIGTAVSDKYFILSGCFITT